MSKQPVRLTALLMAVIVLFTFSFSQVAKAERVMYVNTSPFIDLSTSHWSIHNIMKMNIRGVVSGYTDGSFQPDKPVTQLEAVLMAVRNMDAADQINAVNGSRDLPIDVPTWAKEDYKKELIFAIDQGFIQSADGTFDASTYASRAWMARLMVRMIDKDNEASQLANQVTGFTDDSTIPIWAVGYINVAVKYELVSGYPDNTFKPFNNVTRAETVTLMGRSEQYLPLDDEILSGRITSISGDAFVVNINGNTTTFNMDANTWGFDEGGQVTSWTTLQLGDSIKFINDGNLARYVELLPSTATASTLTATVLHVMPAERVLVAKDATGRIITRSVNTSTLITNQSGQTWYLNQIQEDSEVELAMDSNGNLLSIVLLTQQGSFSNTGIVYAINKSQNLLVLKNVMGDFASYQFDNNLQVNIEGQRFADVDDLQIGDEVKLVVSDDILQEIELVKAQQQMDTSGKIVLISIEKQLLAVEINGSVESYYLTDDCQISIPGMDYPLLSDLRTDDAINLQVTEGKISSIAVTNRVGGNNLQGTVLAVDTGEKILVVTNTTDDIQTYEFSNAAEIDIDGVDNPTLSDLKKDMEVEFQLLNDKIIYLESNNGVEGTVVSINEDRHLIVLLLATGESKTYILSSDPDVDIQDQSHPDVDDIERNDYVEITLENDLVIDINVQKTLLYEVISVYDSSNRLKVEDEDEDTKYLYLYSRVDVVIPGVKSPDTEDFEEGDLVRATYMGHTLEKVEMSPRVTGRITDINTFTGKISIKLFDDTIQTYTFDADSRVVEGSHSSTRLSALAIGDRVEVTENLEGELEFALMTKVSGKFVSKDDDDEKIYITKDYSSSYKRYYLSSDCYIHQGIHTMMLRNIDKDDQLDLYTLNSRVYEIEFQ